MKGSKNALLAAVLVLILVAGLAFIQTQQGRRWAGQQVATQESLLRTSIALTPTHPPR
jgi:hypothetical protein